VRVRLGGVLLSDFSLGDNFKVISFGLNCLKVQLEIKHDFALYALGFVFFFCHFYIPVHIM